MIVRALRRTSVPALVTTSVLLGGITVADAESLSVRDGNDSVIDADIGRVRVAHGDTLVVRVRLDRLRPGKQQVVQGMNVYVDLHRRHAGPELMVEAGLWRTADHVVTRADRWRRDGMLECDSSLGVDPGRDLAVLRLGADCLPDRHPKARVSVLAYESDDDTVGTDWLLGRRTFTDWVARD